MPYIVTQRQPCGNPECCGPVVAPAHIIVSRRAVATLEAAQRLLFDEIGDAGLPFGNGPVSVPKSRARMDTARLPESGGTVGPLPDGTVIEVKRVTTLGLAAQCESRFDCLTAEVIVAYNRSQGIKQPEIL